MPGPARVFLLGLDFGTTTSHAVVASARLESHRGSSRTELADFQITYQSEPVFTPFSDGRLDEGEIRRLLDLWRKECGLELGAFFSAGAIITGLAAEASNARALGEELRSRIGDAVIAVARDPRLESWYAFMGSSYRISRANRGETFLNIDIGGGTSNLALGADGVASQLGSYFVGARHFRFVPGTYRIEALSAYAAPVLHQAGLEKKVGDVLSEGEVDAIVRVYVGILEDLVSGTERSGAALRKSLCQAMFSVPASANPRLTFSGGVGELIYRAAPSGLPSRTAFGDLGVDLARGILASPRLSRDLSLYVPEGRGRATVYGLALHHAVISGATIYLPEAADLPLRDLPLVGKIDAVNGPDSQLAEMVERVRLSASGGCLQLSGGTEKAVELRTLGGRLSRALEGFPPNHPLVIFVSGNFGKTLGNLVTGWGKKNIALIVIDEINPPEAHFASLGKVQNATVPVSFYGIQ